jgi:hypothetical protein
MIGETEKHILGRFDRDSEVVDKVRAAILKTAAEKPEAIQETNGSTPVVESPSEKEEEQTDSKAEKRRLRKLARKKKEAAAA